jgi:hypothetical protein
LTRIKPAASIEFEIGCNPVRRECAQHRLDALEETGPLFNFSEPGWTVDSTDGCVVNNRYLCAPSLAIPEPVSWVLMLTGFSGLGYAGYRKVKTNSALSAV